jgi:hypothetical protein
MKNGSQLNISDRQLLTVDTRHDEGEWTEIGRAEVTRSIFGRAKVHIIREHDKIHRAWFLTGLAALAVTALSVFIWYEQGAPQEAEPLQSADSFTTSNATLQSSAPAPQVENITPTVTTPTMGSKPSTPLQTAIDGSAVSQKSAPQPPFAGQMTAKPIVPRPVIASKPKTAPIATNNDAVRNQTDMQQPPAGTNQLADPINAQRK